MSLKVRVIRGQKGKWQIEGSVAGQRVRRRITAGERAIAEAEAARIEREIWEDRIAARSEVRSFAEAALSYMQADHSRRFMEPLICHFGRLALEDIKPGDIQDAARLLYPGRKPATWNRQCITPAQAVMNHAADRGWCPRMEVRRFAVQKVKRQAIDRQWLDAFMASAEPVIAAVALFMFITGARVGAATAMKWDAVDFHRRAALLPASKGGPARECPLTMEMVAVLAGLERVNDRVFRYAPQAGQFRRKWNEAIERAGIERATPHEAGRHSFATEMIVRRGVDPATTAALGGWKSPRVLMETYAHPERLRDVADEVFGSGGKLAKFRKAE